MAATDEILVIGHHNPDTDAICSALAYADLYHRLTGIPTVACYLDEIGPETAWLIAHLGLALPRHITDVYWHVSDVMTTDAPHVGPQATLREAGLLMRESELGSLPVLDSHQRMIGIVPRELLADRYLELLQLSSWVERSVVSVLEALDATLLAGSATGELKGQVWLGTFSPEVARDEINPGDVVIIEDDSELQAAVLATGAACLIIARNAPIADDVVATAQARGIVVARTPHNSLAAVALLEQSVIVERVMEHDTVVARPDDLLSDAQQHLRSSRRASLPVVDDEGIFLGLLLRRYLVPQDRRRVILTDHNHASQAAAGAAESELIAVIDHHNLGGLRTLQPLTMRIEPLGCCSTLVAEGYRAAGLAPAPALAGAMLGAILSDTVQFRSPTTTPRDQTAAAWLAEISGESVDKLAHAMFRARLPVPAPPPAWWVSRDWKVYTFGAAQIGIAQMELVDVEQVMPPIVELRRELAELAKREGLVTAFLLLTDILDQRSLLIAANTLGEQVASRAFGTPFVDNQLNLPGVMSRKKQVVPPIAAALTNPGNE